MRITTARRISQVFFLVMLVWLCAVSSLGLNWWRVRGWPINLLLQLDPLVALGTMLSTGGIFSGLIWALVTVIGTILLGRFFCGWLCPFGTIQHFVGWLDRRAKKLKDKIRVNRYRRGQSIKYYILIGLLTAAAGELVVNLLALPGRDGLASGVAAIVILAALAILAAMKVLHSPAKAVGLFVLLVGVWAAAGLFITNRGLVAATLQTGLLDPIPLVQRSVNLALLPAVDAFGNVISPTARHYQWAWLIGTIFVAAVLLSLVIPRLYCKFVCPLGALLGVLSRFAILRFGKNRRRCTDCQHCQADCEGACSPGGQIRISECVLCGNCLRTCPNGTMTYSTSVSASGEKAGPDISRRGVLLSLVSGFAAAPLLRLGGKAGPNWAAGLIRPPGAQPEDDFLARCIKCGQCMRVCPTNVIQPAGLEGGLETLWTPTLNNRIGTSGCQFNCVACGQVCPTAAIRPLSLDEKMGRGQFAEAGPIRMGTVFVDRGRCLPWAMRRPCIVCQENCPVSPKAIYLQETFVPVRDGNLTVRGGDELTIDVNEPLEPGRFATGDYFCQVADAGGGPRRLIVANSAGAVTVGDSSPWEQPLQPGQRIAVEIRLQRPVVDPGVCTGCGVCEHECPVSGQRAIRVTAENESRSPAKSLLA